MRASIANRSHNGAVPPTSLPATTAQTGPGDLRPTLAGPGIVSSTAPRTVRHAAGRTGKGLDAKGPYGLTDEIAIPPADQYYLDLAITFREQFEWGAPTTA